MAFTEPLKVTPKVLHARTQAYAVTKAKMVGALKSATETAEAKMRSAEAQFDLEKSRMDRLKSNLEKCVIKAPHDGLVEYANDPQGGGGRGVSALQGSGDRRNRVASDGDDSGRLLRDVTLRLAFAWRLAVAHCRREGHCER